MTFQSHYAVCAGREMHYTEWGAGNPKTVIAWHGLARTGRDMDELAADLVTRGYRVICPDTIGRGLSQWSPDPVNEYQLSFYAKTAQALVDHLGLDRFHWVGTSMGGAIGTVCAAGDLGERMLSLTLNDNGPELAQAAVDRIKAYAAHPAAFDSVTALEAFFRQAYKPFGWLSDAQWRRLTETSARRLPDGRFTPHYDPAMAGQFIHHPDDYRLWDAYDTITLPVLCLRGVDSDLLLRDVTARMQTRGPGAQGRLTVVEVPDCGHAPALNVPSQLNLIADFLAANG